LFSDRLREHCFVVLWRKIKGFLKTLHFLHFPEYDINWIPVIEFSLITLLSVTLNMSCSCCLKIFQVFPYIRELFPSFFIALLSEPERKFKINNKYNNLINGNISANLNTLHALNSLLFYVNTFKADQQYVFLLVGISNYWVILFWHV
jgi:hypothetical protein